MSYSSKNNLLKNFKDLYVDLNEKFDQPSVSKEFQIVDSKVMKEAILKSAKVLEKDLLVNDKVKGKNTAKFLEQKNNSNLGR